ncbi:MAG: AAA family ATPase [Lentisphaerae bacterium]|nr:AAA family ATPase [Lentisphaerota bacterium]
MKSTADHTDNPVIDTLRKAVSQSPDNLHLRRHFAQVLLEAGGHKEAEVEFRAALALAPGDTGLGLGLAKAFFHQGKHSEALVVLEDLQARPDLPAEAQLIHARVLNARGEKTSALDHYRRAVALDADLADALLLEQLGPKSPIDAGTAPWPANENTSPQRREDVEPVPSDETALPEKPGITFKDVGGMEKLKEEIRLKVIYPIQHPEVYKAYGKGIGGGILMFGPPGCGKTHLARATAGEVNAAFVAVGINEVLEMWIGRSESNLHAIFEMARRNKPCVLFFDEVDALGASRADFKNSAGRSLINQFLAELDGVKSDNEGVLILAATNAPWNVDSAFRRPGRFDRIIFVPPPDTEARALILELLLKDKLAKDIDYPALAKRTGSFSGADLKSVVDVATEARIEDALRSGKALPLTTKDLAAAAAKRFPTTREWFATARNYATYSNEGGFYDDVARYLNLV